MDLRYSEIKLKHSKIQGLGNYFVYKYNSTDIDENDNGQAKLVKLTFWS